MAVAEAFVPGGAQRRGFARAGGARKVFTGATKVDKAGLILLGLLIVLGVFAPLIAPYSPIDPSGLPFTPPLHGGHLMGTTRWATTSSAESSSVCAPACSAC